MDIGSELKKLGDAERAKNLQRYFKTGKGEYGEGDIFIGITVPKIRKLSRDFRNCSFEDIGALIESPIHEARLLGLLFMVDKFIVAAKIKDAEMQENIFSLYLEYAAQGRINNWDLVDLSAPQIIGKYLIEKDRSILYELIRRSLWERRIAILATFAFIKNNDFKDSLKIAEILLKDKHDLIQKAVGWMLREVGKRDEKVLKDFLDKYCKVMPRMMLRYAIEKLDEKRRKAYLNG